MLKTIFKKHLSIKISMKCVCINPEVKKLDITGMTTATNGACMGWLHENCYLIAGGMTLSTGGDVNLLREAFLVGGGGGGATVHFWRG